MKKLLFLILFILSSNASAALYGYCLGNGVSLPAAKSYLENFKAPRDQIFIRSSVKCLEVKGSARTFGVYEKVLKQKYKVLRTYQGNDQGIISSKYVQKGVCRIQVIKIGKKDTVQDNIQLGKKAVVRRSEFKGNSKSVSHLVLSYGQPGSMQVNKQRIAVTCRKAGQGYQLSFNLKNADTALSSNAYLTMGQKLNVGGIVNDLNNKQKVISINKGVEYQKETGTDQFDYFLKVR